MGGRAGLELLRWRAMGVAADRAKKPSKCSASRLTSISMGIDVVCLFQDMDLKDLVLLRHLFRLSREYNQESVRAVYIDTIILHP